MDFCLECHMLATESVLFGFDDELYDLEISMETDIGQKKSIFARLKELVKDLWTKFKNWFRKKTTTLRSIFKLIKEVSRNTRYVQKTLTSSQKEDINKFKNLCKDSQDLLNEIGNGLHNVTKPIESYIHGGELDASEAREFAEDVLNNLDELQEMYKVRHIANSVVKGESVGLYSATILNLDGLTSQEKLETAESLVKYAADFSESVFSNADKTITFLNKAIDIAEQKQDTVTASELSKILVMYQKINSGLMSTTNAIHDMLQSLVDRDKNSY